ncbi:uncharacterized protein LOC127803217 [Diospyros lotus]|uniref:uncharacterized protein LOC127803217 n=1 Tax=Diospyros lotus TaxID=55363 RepID=UPI00224D51CD|nr:uncharacterized protein LOC127803217 [Diospyros lotus]
MATVSGFSSLCSICQANSRISSSSSSCPSIPRGVVHLQGHGGSVNRIHSSLAVALSSKKHLQRRRGRKMISLAAEDDAQIPEQAESEDGNNTDNTEQAPQEEPAAADLPVSVPVSPSDVLSMFFQAEGTMNETAIPAVTNALQETEGVTNLKVQVAEGIATVELTKQTTIQATGVASNLVEIIQGSGFKLQTINLSFEDEDDII